MLIGSLCGRRNSAGSPSSSGQCSVYPHACGEHVPADLPAGRMGGLPPRLWGTQWLRLPSPLHMRFIPTPVGNTDRIRRITRRRSVYPHACGEHGLGASLSQKILGLSPRLWGTRVGRGSPTLTSPVYPHACGEHCAIVLVVGWGRGLSPRLWGTHRRPVHGPRAGRFIPTPVGNTEPSFLGITKITVYPHACGEHATRRGKKTVSLAVYPHACGEHVLDVALKILERGLSPRLWGTLTIRNIKTSQNRFIPTPVGNTFADVRRGGRHSVYPHACGEHNTLPSKATGLRGLSPRLWGTLKDFCSPFLLTRFIPTPVGNTWTWDISPVLAAVYPHACGEHRHHGWDIIFISGLSPRLWGTP